VGYTFDERMAVLGPHVHDGVPLVRQQGRAVVVFGRWSSEPGWATRGAGGRCRPGRGGTGAAVPPASNRIRVSDTLVAYSHDPRYLFEFFVEDDLDWRAPPAAPAG